VRDIDTIYCTDALELMADIDTASVDLVFADPPYNVSRKNMIFRDYRSGRDGNINYDYGEWDYTYDPIPFLEEAKRILTDEGSIIVWTSEQLYGVYRTWFEEHMYPKQLLVWEKTNPVPNFRKNSHRTAQELMFWAAKGKINKNNPNFNFTTQEEMKTTKKAPIVGGRERLKRPDTGKSHPNQKPESICRHIVRVHCRPGGLVVDPYCGVGTIPASAKREGRHFIGGDFDPVYADMAIRRVQAIAPE
jgi:modification methylase